jgi:phosphonate transport system substrate-binding protein
MILRNVVLTVLLALSASLSHAEGYKPSGGATSPEATSTEQTYIFGIHPYANPQELLNAYAFIMRYLESKVPGSHFEMEASRDYTDYESKLAARRFHFSLPNPVQGVMTFDSGYRVIAKMTPDEDFQGIFIARAGTISDDPKQLAGKTLCFTSATALAATLQPLLWLHDQGVDVKSLNIRYVGSQFSSLLNAWSGEYAACGSAPRFFRAWLQKNPGKATEMQIVWRTPPLMHNPVIARDDVPAEVADQVAQALAGLDKDPAVDQSQFIISQQHFELADNQKYLPIIEFLRRYDAAIGLPEAIKIPKGL